MELQSQTGGLSRSALFLVTLALAVDLRDSATEALPAGSDLHQVCLAECSCSLHTVAASTAASNSAAEEPGNRNRFFSPSYFRVDCRAKNLTGAPQASAPASTSLSAALQAEELLLCNNDILELDLAFLRSYPNLKFLSVRLNRLRAVSKSDSEDYRPFFSVLHLDLSDNCLHVIHPFVFSGFPSLRTLNLSGNALHTLSENAFALPALQTLDLSRNRLGTIHPSVFSSSPLLTEVDLSHNGLSRINDGLFMGSGSPMPWSSPESSPPIPPQTASSSSSSSSLSSSLSSSSSSSSSPSLSASLSSYSSKLSLLDLSHNSLMILEPNSLVEMNVTHLDLGHNNLRRPPTLPLQKVIRIQTLVLDGNAFSVLEAGALDAIRAEFVSLSRCPQLTRLERGAIRSMPVLRALTINANPKLAYLEPGFVSDAPHLAALDLARNSLFALEGDRLVEALPGLKAIYLAGNPFNCHCSLAWMEDLVLNNNNKNNLRQPGGSPRRPSIDDSEDLYCSEAPPGSGPRRRPLVQPPTAAAPGVAGFAMGSCKPYILPLFPASDDGLMGRDTSWLCRAVGSEAGDLTWRFSPDTSSTTAAAADGDAWPKSSTGMDPEWPESPAGMDLFGVVNVRDGHCVGRLCVRNGSLTVRYLHPSDSGRYTCLVKSQQGQDRRQVHLKVKSEHIQIFPVTVGSRFTTLSWNTSTALSTGRGYILQVRSVEPDQSGGAEQPPSLSGASSTPGSAKDSVRSYEDIEVGIKMNSYTVSGLDPGTTYRFELCLKREDYVIPISHAVLTTRDSGYEVGHGIRTDWVTLAAVVGAVVLLAALCFFAICYRWWFRYRSYVDRIKAAKALSSKVPPPADDSSQRGMMTTSPSDHSSVAVSSSVSQQQLQAAQLPTGPGGHFRGAHSRQPPAAGSLGGSPDDTASSCSSTGEENRRLVEHELASPVDDELRVLQQEGTSSRSKYHL